MFYTPNSKELEGNPIIDVAVKYFKLSEAAWDKIWRIVAQNSAVNFGGNNPHSDVMASLLNMDLE